METSNITHNGIKYKIVLHSLKNVHFYKDGGCAYQYQFTDSVKEITRRQLVKVIKRNEKAFSKISLKVSL